MTFEDMTDEELLDFCYDRFCNYDVCKALDCEEDCTNEDCPLAQLFERFKRIIEKGGVSNEL